MVVSSFSEFGALVVGASPISFRVCIFLNQKINVYLILKASLTGSSVEAH